MADADDRPDVTDLVPALFSELYPQLVPVRAVILIEAIDVDGSACLIMRSSSGTKTWHSMGMLHNALIREQQASAEGWDEAE